MDRFFTDATVLLLRSRTYYQKIKQLFGSSIIGYWPMSEASGLVAFDYSGNGFHGVYNNVTLGQPGIGDGRTCPLFNGLTSFMQPPVGFRSTFNNQEGTAFCWVRNNIAWSDATIRGFIRMGADGNNIASIQKQGANSVAFFYVAGGISKSVSRTTTETEWSRFCITWSKSTDRFIAYFNGVQTGLTQTGLGVWVGTLTANLTVFGALAGTPSGSWDGWEADVCVLNRVATPAEVAMV